MKWRWFFCYLAFSTKKKKICTLVQILIPWYFDINQRPKHHLVAIMSRYNYSAAGVFLRSQSDEKRLVLLYTCLKAFWYSCLSPRSVTQDSICPLTVIEWPLHIFHSELDRKRFLFSQHFQSCAFAHFTDSSLRYAGIIRTVLRPFTWVNLWAASQNIRLLCSGNNKRRAAAGLRQQEAEFWQQMFWHSFSEQY